MLCLLSLSVTVEVAQSGAMQTPLSYLKTDILFIMMYQMFGANSAKSVSVSVVHVYLAHLSAKHSEF